MTAMTTALVALGSNLGDRKAHLDFAVASLSATAGLVVLAVSSYHETPPVGGPVGQGAFLNAAASVSVALSPHELLDRLLEIEERTGRVRNVRWEQRTLDLDLLQFGDQILHDDRLVVPHPRMALRRFVLAPLVEIAPATIHPMTGRTIHDLLANLDQRPSVVTLGPTLCDPRSVLKRVAQKMDACVLTDPEPLRLVGIPSSDPPDPEALLAHRADALACEKWSDLGDRWLVTNMRMLDSLGEATNRWVDDNSGRWNNFWTQFRKEHRRVVSSTFVVEQGSPQRPPFFPPSVGPQPPVLWIEPGAPEWIASEIVATCAATRARTERKLS